MVSFINGKLIPTKPENPFDSKTLWLASTKYKKVPVNESFKVVIPRALFFKNLSSNQTIQSLEINFSDGLGYRAVSFNQPLNVLYSGEGGDLKVVSLKWQTSNGVKYTKLTWQTSLACPNVPPVDRAPWPDLIQTFDYTTISMTPSGLIYNSSTRTIAMEHLFESSISYNGIKAKGKAYIKYRNGIQSGQKNFSKPIIFVEGLDLSPSGSGAFLGLELINSNPSFTPLSSTKIGNTGWPQLWGCQDDGIFSTATPYLDSLSNEGYDIIMLDFWDGADHIQRNAYLLIELIQRINNHKVGSEPNVIIGASMGGQVARYALTYMEHNNIPHCTRLNISFDSPWHGAHIPLSLQAFLDYQANEKKEVDNKWE